jgi:hypothetical protein
MPGSLPPDAADTSASWVFMVLVLIVSVGLVLCIASSPPLRYGNVCGGMGHGPVVCKYIPPPPIP